MAEDPLAKWRKPGSVLTEQKESDGVVAVAPLTGIRPREYKAFTSEAGIPLLLIKRGTVKQPATDLDLAYTYLTKIISDGYGFSFSLTFALPFPSGPAIVEIRGEGMGAMLEGIRRGTVASVQIFDPDRHLPAKEGDWDIEAHEWRGPCVIKHLAVTTRDSKDENTTTH
jgi:hypothetical protein